MIQMTNTIERAFQLAEQSMTLGEIMVKLKREGHFHVDAHLDGKKIRADLRSVIGRHA